MSFAVDDGPDPAGVATAGDHAQVARLELDEVHDLSGRDVQTDRVVNLKNNLSNKLRHKRSKHLPPLKLYLISRLFKHRCNWAISTVDVVIGPG